MSPAAAHAEHDLQRAVLRWLEETDPELRAWTIHCPNGRNAGTARKAGIWRALGVAAGVPDLLVFQRRGDFAGMALELKAGKGRPSKAQFRWLEHLAAQGWWAGWANSLESAQEAFRRYLACDPAPLGRAG